MHNICVQAVAYVREQATKACELYSHTLTNPAAMWLNEAVIPRELHTLYEQFYSDVISKIPLFFDKFSPLSTPPIISTFSEMKQTFNNPKQRISL